MNNFQCTSCGAVMQRAVAPLSCPTCGQQRVGLFRALPAGMVPQQPQMPQQPMMPQQGGLPQQPMMPQQPMQPQQPFPQQPAQQQGMNYPQQGGMPQQPMAPQQTPMPLVGQQPGQVLSSPPVPGAGQPGQTAFPQQPNVPLSPTPQQPMMPQQPVVPQQPVQTPGFGQAPLQPTPIQPQQPVPQQAVPQQPVAPQPIPPQPPVAQQPVAPQPPPQVPPQAPPAQPPTQQAPPRPPAAPVEPRKAKPKKQKPQKPQQRQSQSTDMLPPSKPATKNPRSESSSASSPPPEAKQRDKKSPPPETKPGKKSSSPKSPPSASKSPDRVPAEKKTTAPKKSARADKPIPPSLKAKRPEPKEGEHVAWTYIDEASQDHSHAGLRNAVAVGDQGRLYACVSGRLVALQEKEGEVKRIWEYATDSHIPGSPVFAPDGNLRVHCSDGMLHCVDTSGSQVWAPVSVGDPLGWASPVMDADSSTWICGYNGGLLKVDHAGRTSGRPFFRSRQKFDCTGLAFEGVFYVGGEDGFVYAIEISGRNGKNRWDHVAERGKTDWFINSALAMAGGRELIVASRDGFLYGFSLNGKQLWKVQMPGQMLASPVVDGKGNIYVGISQATRGQDAKGMLACVSGKSHKMAWQYQADAPVESTPVIGDDGAVYFGDNSGVVHAVDSDGNRLWQQPLGSAVRSAGVIVAPQRVVFGLDDDCLVALKCSSKAQGEGWTKYMGPGL